MVAKMADEKREALVNQKMEELWNERMESDISSGENSIHGAVLEELRDEAIWILSKENKI
jgi:hypothetical protein